MRSWKYVQTGSADAYGDNYDMGEVYTFSFLHSFTLTDH
jgi:hypothetical protein